MKLNSFSHSCGELAYHMVFVPKYRKPIFADSEVRHLCRAIFYQVAHRQGYTIHALEFGQDHVHMFVALKPSCSVSLAFQHFKGFSAFRLFRYLPELRYQFRRGHFWSRGKFVRSVGSVTADAVEHYIKNSQHSWNNISCA